jgi:hypothetical protein
MHEKTTSDCGCVGRKFYWSRILDLMAPLEAMMAKTEVFSTNLKMKVRSQD